MFNIVIIDKRVSNKIVKGILHIAAYGFTSGILWSLFS